ncbi:MAG: acetyl-CoA carboxylase, carboxyltransferase subunit beta [Rhodospirillaceae bacterium]
MNWLTNYVRPKIRELVGPKEVPENLWDKCPACGQMVFHKEMAANQYVCTACGHHLRLTLKARLELLFDEAQYDAVELPKAAVDPLKFRDLKRYSDRLKEAQSKTGAQDAIKVVHGKINGIPTVVAAFDFAFMGGSMGMAVGEAIVVAANLAKTQDSPLIVIPASGGARMQEGILSLMQMARTTVAVEEVKDAGLPYIVLLTDPTTGGVSASFAMLGDVAIAEPGAVIGFAGARVIEQTIRETLPDGFQRAEYLREHGMVDMVVPRHELKETLGTVLSLLCRPNPPAEVLAFPTDDSASEEPAEEGSEAAEAGADPQDVVPVSADPAPESDPKA